MRVALSPFLKPPRRSAPSPASEVTAPRRGVHTSSLSGHTPHRALSQTDPHTLCRARRPSCPECSPASQCVGPLPASSFCPSFMGQIASHPPCELCHHRPHQLLSLCSTACGSYASETSPAALHFFKCTPAAPESRHSSESLCHHTLTQSCAEPQASVK